MADAEEATFKVVEEDYAVGEAEDEVSEDITPIKW